MNLANARLSIASTSSGIFLFSRNQRLRNYYRIFKSIFIRLILAAICIYILISYQCMTKGKKLYYLFLIPIVVIVIETMYIAVRRKGNDFRWFVDFFLILLNIITSTYR